MGAPGYGMLAVCLLASVEHVPAQELPGPCVNSPLAHHPPHLTSSIPSLAPTSWEGRVTNHPLPTHPPTNLGTPEGTMMQGRPHKVVRTRRYRARFAFEPKSQRRVGGTLDLNASACWPRLPCVWVISFCVHQCFFAGNGVHPWEE